MESATFRKWLVEQGCRFDRHKRQRREGRVMVTVHREGRCLRSSICLGCLSSTWSSRGAAALEVIVPHDANPKPDGIFEMLRFPLPSSVDDVTCLSLELKLHRKKYIIQTFPGALLDLSPDGSCGPAKKYRHRGRVSSDSCRE